VSPIVRGGVGGERTRIETEASARRVQLESDHADAKALYDRLGPVIDVEAEVTASREQVAALEARRGRLEEEARRRLSASPNH
jgi:hypothetical protein